MKHKLQTKKNVKGQILNLKCEGSDLESWISSAASNHKFKTACLPCSQHESRRPRENMLSGQPLTKVRHSDSPLLQCIFRSIFCSRFANSRSRNAYWPGNAHFMAVELWNTTRTIT